MKKHILTALIGAALTLPLVAQAQGFYAGASAGSAEQKLNLDGFSFNDSDTAYKVYGGYDFTKHVGLEVGYVDMGTSTFSDDSGNSITSKMRSTYVAVTGTQVINTKFSLTGKIGVSHNHGTYGGDDGSVNTISKNQQSTMYGIGLTYHVSNKVSAVLEYEDFGKVLKESADNIKADLISVGLRYKF